MGWIVFAWPEVRQKQSNALLLSIQPQKQHLLKIFKLGAGVKSIQNLIAQMCLEQAQS
jgi:hypothetical protein